MSANGSLLRCTDVSKHFGGFRAVEGMSVEIGSGIVSIIGSNGAGKTTFFNCVSGLVRPDRGTIMFDGNRIDGLSQHEIARLGLARTFQTVRVFNGLSVIESMLVAQVPGARSGSIATFLGLAGARAEEKARLDKARAKLDLIGFEGSENTRVEALPLLARRKLEIAQALATDPKLLLLDEPTAGATAGEIDELLRVVTLLTAGGMTVLLIEHNMRVVMDVSDRVYVMHLGALLAKGTPAEVQADPQVRGVYLGER